MATWVAIVGGLAVIITGGTVILKFVLSVGRAVSIFDEFMPLVTGDEKATPPVLPLKDRLNTMEKTVDNAYHEARAAKETSVAVLRALSRKGLEL